MLHIYLMTLIGVCLGQLTPGPNLFAIAGTALGQGWRTSLWMAFGIATAIFFWVTLATFGLATLLSIYPALLAVLKMVGGGYFCFLSFKSLRSACRAGNVEFKATSVSWTPLTAWRKGLFVNLSNPKSALMWGAITTFMFGSGLTYVEVLGFAPIGFACAVVIYGGYGFLFSTPVMRGLYVRFTRIFEGVFGAVFGLAGTGLIVSGIRDVAR